MLPSPAELVAAGRPRVEATRVDLGAVARRLQSLAPAKSGLAAASADELVDAFRHLLFQPALAEHVATAVHPILLHILAPLLDASPSSWADAAALPTLRLLAALLPVYEETYPLVLEYLSQPALADGPVSGHEGDGPGLQATLMAYWRLVTASPDLCTSLPQPWPTFPLETLYRSPALSSATRYLALLVFAARTNLSERVRDSTQARFIGSPDALTATDGTATYPLSTLVVSECARVQRIWNACATERPPIFTRPIQNAADVDFAMLGPDNLHPRIVSLGGVLMLRDAPAPSSAMGTGAGTGFVETPSCLAALRDLAVHTSVGAPTLVSGPAASGKTAILAHIHSLVHPATAPRGLLSIALGDNTGLDAKALLGSYTSSPRHPGRFEWVEGALARAVRLGYWVVLEDIDRGSPEVLSVVKELAKDLSPTRPVGTRPGLSLGARGSIKAAPGFRLFATRSVDSSARRVRIAAQGHQPATGEEDDVSETQAFPAPSFAGAAHWSEVRLLTPSRSDVLVMLQSLFPTLEGPSVPTFISAFEQLRAAEAAASASSPSAALSRQPTLRDLIKWVTRIHRIVQATGLGGDAALHNPVVQEQVFLDGIDIFLGSIAAQEHMRTTAQSGMDSGERQRIALASVLARALSIGDERVDWVLRHRAPELGKSTASSGAPSLSVGRARLPIALAQPGQPRGPSTFAMTKSSVCLMEQLGCAVGQGEPLLLVGETGTGKTTVVQQLARMVRRPLTALNLSQQSEASDLLGGFKPIEPRMPAMELHNDWHDLFTASFSAKRNAKFMEAERKALSHGKWSKLADLWIRSAQMAADSANKPPAKSSVGAGASDGGDAKRRRLDRSGAREASPATAAAIATTTSPEDNERAQRWQHFTARVQEFRLQHVGPESQRRKFHFAFVEGPLVRALRRGEWILLDEINLAADETLEFLSGLLQSSTSSITLTERGDLEPVPRHPHFRLFACMNPATDVGKKSLPAAIRARFTELYVPSPDSDREALRAIVEKYVGELAARDKAVVDHAAQAYLDVKTLAQRGEVADGANQRPHHSIRTLARALTSAVHLAASFGLRRALFEGFLMCFTMGLDAESTTKITDLLTRKLLPSKDTKQLLRAVARAPSPDLGPHVQLGPFWLPEGPLGAADAPGYVITPSVQVKLVALARAVAIGRYPVLIQGPTSAGKTSAIEYLARRTGHRFVRINNHEHTDLQEYLGAYASDPATGALRFQEGLLVRALRRGDWIVLDELNLAPTDVLEALNRLLDDNRELLIPETGEVVRPHPSFMLFATQNPPGLYGGRKVLSRAFRNRFLEAHFDDVPTSELAVILENRCAIPRSYADKIVHVFHELTRRRQSDRVFETKHSFATLRDLFRWGAREAVGYEQLAENGYMLIAERTRRPQDRMTVQEVLEDVFRVKIEPQRLYDLADASNVLARHLGPEFAYTVRAAVEAAGLTCTRALQRLLCLQCTAFKYNEPILFVGEPGTGKTAVCAITASAFKVALDVVNCHQNTDASDLLGGMRPLRNRASVVRSALHAATQALGAAPQSLDQAVQGLQGAIAQHKSDGAPVSGLGLGELEGTLALVQRAGMLFEWYDGPLILAMLRGDHILLDEISLADDSVLERLNSVLEPARTITLPNRVDAASASAAADAATDEAAHMVTALQTFQVAATMNPGGDYGKKELSPALRNRFTEVWVPPIDNRDDVRAILLASLHKVAEKDALAEAMLDFAVWLSHEVGMPATQLLTLRDYLAWAAFVVATSVDHLHGTRLSVATALSEGANLVVLEGLPTLLGLMSLPPERLPAIRQRATALLAEKAGQIDPAHSAHTLDGSLHMTSEDGFISLGPYRLPKFSQASSTDNGADSTFAFDAPTTAQNALNVLRALQVPSKSVLLEGSPGAGKTSLVAALAAAAGQDLIRINLSEQTEVADLFGSEMPQPAGKPGEFAWRDAAFLTALKEGKWVLLDEMNLASQSVLEGLNSTLDHRGEIYVPELDRTFSKHDEFRVFAAQNPQSQGGGRKGLPQSFLNRFTKVHVHELTSDDFFTVCRRAAVGLSESYLTKVIEFNKAISSATAQGNLGRLGRPWEFNLRDILRWIQVAKDGHSDLRPEHIVRLLYVSRFRSVVDHEACAVLFEQVFGYALESTRQPSVVVSPATVSFEGYEVDRVSPTTSPIYPAWLQSQMPKIEYLSACVQRNWLAILNGPPGVGKTATIQLAAKLIGVDAEVIRLNAMSDASDLLGSFEQVDPEAAARETLADLAKALAKFTAEHAAQDDFVPLAAQTPLHKLVHLLRELNNTSDAPQLISSISERVKALASLPALPLVLAQILNRVDGQLDAELAQLDAHDDSTAGARFTWTDGPLVRCIREGRWVILQDANQCPSAVLDRLNSLFENDAVLVLAEKGAFAGEVEVLRPHPSFRLFMTSDPATGELSRAMRNRGIEITFLPIASKATTQQDTARLHWTARSGRPLLLPPSELPPQSLATGPSTWAFCRPLLEFTLLRVPMTALSQSLTQPHKVADDDLYGYIAEGTLFLGSLSPATKAAATQLVGHHPDLLAALAAQDLDGIVHASWQTTRDPLVCPQRASNNLEELKRRSIVQQLQDRAHIITARLAHLTDDLVALPENAPLLHAFLYHKRTQPRALWPPSLGQMDVAGLLEQLLGPAAVPHGAGGLDEATLALYADVHDAVLYIIRLCLAQHLNFAALHHVMSQLSQAPSLRQLSADHPLVGLCADISKSLDVLVQRRGIGMSAIWEEFACSASTPAAVGFSNALRALAASRDKTSLTPIIAFLTTLFHHADSVRSEDAATLDQISSVVGSDRASSEITAVRFPALLCAVAAISPFSASDSTVTFDGNALVRTHALEFFHADTPATARLLLRRIVGAQGTDRVSQAVLTHLDVWDLSWARDFWSERTTLADYFRPFLLKSSQSLLDARRVRLSELGEGRQRRCQQELALLLNSMAPSSRSDAFKEHFLVVMYLLTIVLRDASARGGAQEEVLMLSELSQRFPDTTQAFGALLGVARADLFGAVTPSATWSQRVVAWTHASSSVLDKMGDSLDLMCLGSGVVHIALQFLQLFVSEVPVDPLAARHSLAQFQQVRQERGASTSKVALAFESRTLQRSALPLAKAWPAESSFAGGAEDALGGHDRLPGRGSDLELLSILTYEVNSFMQDVIDPSKILALLSALVAVADDQHASSREALLQQSIGSFIQQLEKKYAGLIDLVAPVTFSLDLLSVGFQAVRAGVSLSGSGAGPSPRSSRSARIFEALLSPSSPVSAQMVTETGRVRKVHSPYDTQLLLIHLAAKRVLVLAGEVTAEAAASSTRDILESLAEVHRQQIEARARAKEEETSIFKSKTETVVFKDDDELAEEEFRSLFPDYETFEEPSEPAQPTKSHKTLLTDENANLACSLVLLSTAPEAYKMYDFTRRDFVSRWLSDSYTVLDDRADQLGAHQMLVALCGPSHGATQIPDFYHDVDPAEAELAIGITNKFLARLKDLILDWPEQDALRHLADRCEAILAMHSASPVPKLMGAFEQLLELSDDWEGFASSATSIRVHREAVTATIIRWRKMELHSWQHLLDLQVASHRDRSKTHFFPLYSASVSASWRVVAGDDTSVVLPHYLELLSLLDQFMRSSPLGEYEGRLALLSALADHCESLARDRGAGEESRWALPTAHVLRTSWAFFTVFLKDIQAHVGTERAKMEKEIGEFTKIASWKDTNIHALRQSAHKTHRKLHKVVSSFRKLLNSTADAVLAAGRTAVTPPVILVQAPGVTPALSADLTSNEVKALVAYSRAGKSAVLSDLSRTLTSVHRMHRDTLTAILAATTSEFGTELSEEIRSTADDLRSRTPSIMTKKNEKLVKALLTEKTRAFTSVLKQLRLQGISSLYRDDEGNKARVMAHMDAGISSPFAHRLSPQIVAEADGYYLRLLAVLPMLRASLPKRSPDIPPELLLRAHGTVENLVDYAAQDRTSRRVLMEHAESMGQLVARLVSLNAEGSANIFVLSAKVQGDLEVALGDAVVLLDSALQLREEVSILADIAKLSTHLRPVIMSDIDELVTRCGQAKASLQAATTNSRVTSVMIVSDKDVAAIQEGLELYAQSRRQWGDLRAAWPLVRSFSSSIVAWADVSARAARLASRLADAPVSTDTSEEGVELISTALLVAQNLKRLEDTAHLNAAADEKRFQLQRQDNKRVESIFLTLSFGATLASLFPGQGGGARHTQAAGCWLAVLPFLQEYQALLMEYIEGLIQSDLGYLRFAHTASVILLDLTTKGFCTPQEQDESGEGDDDDDDAEDGGEIEDGTGLGDGTGAKDISDQLKDDEQIEELQKQEDDPQQQQEGETQAEKNAKEMDDDFDGDLGNLEFGDEDGDQDEDQGDDGGMDDAMDKVDQDLDEEIDEQMWSGENEPEPETTEEKGQAGQEADNLDHAKEDGPEDAKAGPQDAPQQGDEEAGEEDNSGEEGQNPEQQDGDDGNEDDDGDRKDQKEPEQSKSAPEIDPLAGDLDMDQEEAEESGSEDQAGAGSEDDEMPEQEEAQQEGSTLDPDKPEPETDTEGTQEKEDGDQPESGAPDEQEASAVDGGDAESEGKDDEPMPDRSQCDGEEEDKPGDEEVVPKDMGEGQDDGDNAEEGGQGENAASQAVDAAQDPMGQDAPGEEEGEDHDRPELDGAEEDAAAAPAPATTEQDGQSGAQQRAADAGSMEQAADEGDARPEQRSLGDALREFRRDIERIFNNGQGPEEEALVEDGEEPMAVEHVGEDEHTNMQSVGATEQNEESNLKGAAIDTEQDESSNRLDDTQPDSQPQELSTSDLREMAEQELEEGQREGSSSGETKPGQETFESNTHGDGEQPHESPMIEIDDMPEEDLDLESRYADFRAQEPGNLEDAAGLWQTYVSRTSELAFRLSEQLRLILTPTLATRMRGDYRTGKRLNMRQIIPFIASDFAKDKIWLRRTRPSARQYQILLAVDDSKSMGYSRSAHLAVQTIALLQGALTKLEAGDMAVCRFGAQMDILHGFGQRVFSPAEGARMLSQLTFAQRSTDVLKLLQSTVAYLMDARASQPPSAAELWQLALIVSDGMTQDHDRIRALLRKANEIRIVVVFIVLDSLNDGSVASVSKDAKESKPPQAAPQASSSILTLKKVDFTESGGISMTPYLDTFPFENYVIVRDISTLPDVLSATLRQWAERVNAE